MAWLLVARSIYLLVLGQRATVEGLWSLVVSATELGKAPELHLDTA